MNRAARLRAVLALVALLGLSGTAAQQPTAIDRLQPCAAEEGPTDAFCGGLRVFENRETGAGRTVDLRIVVLPALGSNARPDPRAPSFPFSSARSSDR
jgi:hypothetical protein